MQKLYDSDARLLGYLSVSGAQRQVLYDSDYGILGYYYPATDKTYNRDMRLIGRGNLLTSLLAAPVRQEGAP